MINGFQLHRVYIRGNEIITSKRYLHSQCYYKHLFINTMARTYKTNLKYCLGVNKIKENVVYNKILFNQKRKEILPFMRHGWAFKALYLVK